MSGQAPSAPEAAMRMALASSTIAEAADFWAATLVDWVESTEPLDATDGLETTADAALTRLRWRITGQADVIAAAAGRWHGRLGLKTDPADVERAAAVAGGRAGTWVDLGPDEVLAGWDVDVAPGVDLGALRPLLPATAPVEALFEWCAATGASTAVRVAAVAGGDDAELRIALPGGSTDAQVGAFTHLLDHLEIGQLADPVLGTLAALGRPRFVASVALTPDGVSSVAIGSLEPSTDAVLALRERAGVGDDRALAAFEGVLDAPQRTLLEAVRAAPDTVRIGYRVR